MHQSTHHKGLRLVAALEAFKGCIVLVAGILLFSSFGKSPETSARHLIEYLHLNPTGDYASRFIKSMAAVDGTHLGLLGAIAIIYSLLRFIEAYGLWRQRRWAEWFAALGGVIYIPFEIYELIRHPSWITVGALLLNLIIVIYMVRVLQGASYRNAIPQEKT